MVNPFLLHIFHGDNTLDHGEQDNRNNDELQQIDEDVAKGLDILRSEVTATGKIKNQAGDHADDQRDQDLNGETEFLLHTFHLIKILFLTLLPSH